jgi:DNA-binding MarR family transcriptional regulator
MSDTWLKTSLQLSQIERAIKEELLETQAAKLPVSAIYVLNALYREDGQRPMDLAKAIGAAATSFTPVLDKLESAKLVRRNANKDDRRSVLVYLTVAGKELEKPIENAIYKAEIKIRSGK